MTDRVPSFRRNAAPTPNVVRSDATTLHVDFENVADTLITARNAGVVIDYQTRAQILHPFAFQGRRCAHIPPNPKGEQTQIRLIRAWDAPPAGDGAALEFVYRPALDKPVYLHDWPIAQCFSPGGAPGAFELTYLNDPVYGADAVIAGEGTVMGRPQPVAIELRAHGHPSDGAYSVNVVSGEGVERCAVANLPQTAWTRFILRRKNGRVDLFAGPPEEEAYVGAFADILAEAELYMVRLGNPDDPSARGGGYWDAVRLGRPLAKGRRPATPEPPIRNVGAEVPEPPRPLTLGREKLFFIDDWAIEETRNIRRVFHRPAKRADNPLIVCEHAWEPHSLGLGGGIERKRNGAYRMWYMSADPTPENRKNRHTCLALSDDGIVWTKPDLGVHEYKGSSKNNIVIMDSGSSHVFCNPDDPRRDFRYLAKIRHQGTQGWSSPDGIHWTNHGVIIPQSLDATTCNWDPARKKYIASVKLGYKGRRNRGYAESDDFLRWTDTYLMADVDHLDARGDQVYTMSFRRYESLYVGMMTIYHVGTSDTCDIQFAVSHNCMHWERPFRAIGGPTFATKQADVIEYPDPHTQPLLPTGPPGSWDFGGEYTPPSGFVTTKDEIRIYYSGSAASHDGINPAGREVPGAMSSIGLATMRLDGFVSAEAGASGGWIVTRPLKLNGARLYVNANAKGGRAQVEILDRHMNPIEPFTLANARAVRADAVRKKCGWAGVDDLAALAGKTVRLRFHLTNAAIYAFWCE